MVADLLGLSFADGVFMAFCILAAAAIVAYAERQGRKP